MKTLLEPEDIEAIAQRIVEIMLPLLNANQRQDDTILTIEQVSSLIGKTKGQVYQWVSDSKHGLSTFPFMKCGKSLRFSKKAILEWMKNNGNNC